MMDFFPIETPYDSKDYKMMQKVVNMGIDSHLEAFTKSEFKKSPSFANKFLWNIHNSELPILYRRLEKLYDESGDDDYQSLLDDIKNVAGNSEEAVSGEMDEMLDPYDPMNANQTQDGFPAGNSDLQGDDSVMAEIAFEISEAELKEMIQSQLAAMNNPGIENYIDDDTKAQELAAESSSDSLMNQHGQNLKPETLDETYGDRYERIVFMQGDEASEAMDIMHNDGPEATLEYLKQWHYPGEHDGSNEIGAGKYDDKFEKDGYIMNWNSRLPYISLVYDTQAQMNEDSQMKRHLAGQRGKDAPLGQHAPHSQATKK
jgi:hypothetical protein